MTDVFPEDEMNETKTKAKTEYAEQAQAATERPWKVRALGKYDDLRAPSGEAGDFIIIGADGISPGTVWGGMGPESRANAALIVRAVNSYDAMREALTLAAKDLTFLLKEVQALRPGTYRAEATLTRVLAALALANPEASQEQP